MERNEIEDALSTALEALQSAVEEVDAANLKILQGQQEADKALINVERAARLVKKIQHAIGAQDG